MDQASGTNLLMLKIEKGNKKEITSLIKKCPHLVNLQNKSGNTALSTAIRLGDVESVKLIIENKGQYSFRNKAGQTPLYIACFYEQHEIVECLLKQSNIQDMQPDKRGWTPLFIASHSGNQKIIKSLISKGNQNFAHRNNKGESVLDVAKNWEIIQFIISINGYNFQDFIEMCPIPTHKLNNGKREKSNELPKKKPRMSLTVRGTENPYNSSVKNLHDFQASFEGEEFELYDERKQRRQTDYDYEEVLMDKQKLSTPQINKSQSPYAYSARKLQKYQPFSQTMPQRNLQNSNRQLDISNQHVSQVNDDSNLSQLDQQWNQYINEQQNISEFNIIQQYESKIQDMYSKQLQNYKTGYFDKLKEIFQEDQILSIEDRDMLENLAEQYFQKQDENYTHLQDFINFRQSQITNSKQLNNFQKNNYNLFDKISQINSSIFQFLISHAEVIIKLKESSYNDKIVNMQNEIQELKSLLGQEAQKNQNIKEQLVQLEEEQQLLHEKLFEKQKLELQEQFKNTHVENTLNSQGFDFNSIDNNWNDSFNQQSQQLYENQQNSQFISDDCFQNSDTYNYNQNNAQQQLFNLYQLDSQREKSQELNTIEEEEGEFSEEFQKSINLASADITPVNNNNFDIRQELKFIDDAPKEENVLKDINQYGNIVMVQRDGNKNLTIDTNNNEQNDIIKKKQQQQQSQSSSILMNQKQKQQIGNQTNLEKKENSFKSRMDLLNEKINNRLNVSRQIQQSFKNQLESNKQNQENHQD